MISIRVHQQTYDRIKEAAAKDQLSISEYAERRLALWEEHPEAALREKGYVPVLLDVGTIWCPPEAQHAFNLNVSVSAATIAEEMGCPGLQPLIQQALRKIYEKRGFRQ